ncbi:MAG: prepilin-type N-terminal cleavage/methylation domain-containing protein [Candidatus Sumerlaeaceae bacterium]
MMQRRVTAFTLIELLVVVAIIAILALIAVPNFLQAKHRAIQTRCAANLKTLAQALYTYRVDLDKYPLADGIAGIEESMAQTSAGNGPAANGSWDAVPRVLVRLRYLATDDYLFCPCFKEQFRSERLQRFRYAYNNSAADTGGTGGSTNDVDRDSHDIWLARCLWVPTARSFHPEAREVQWPHGKNHDRENVLYSNSRVELANGQADFERANPAP